MASVALPDDKAAAIEDLLVEFFPGHSIRFEQDGQSYGIVVCIDGPSGILVHRISIFGEFIDDNDAEAIVRKLRTSNLGVRLPQLGRDPLVIAPD